MSIRRALVVSPTPSHPTDRGNRNRVWQTTNFLAAEGYSIDFVLYPMDSDFRDGIPDSVTEMQAAWGGIVAIVPPSMPMHEAPQNLHHAIDDWYDPAVDAQVSFLCSRRDYSVMWVHYAFFSATFSNARQNCLKILDTHDVLSARRELFERNNANPEFFRTTVEEESKALRRADVVVAIKPSEAAHFASLCDRLIVTVPAVARGGKRAERQLSDGPLKVGFIGADNSINRINLIRFLDRLRAFRSVFLPDLRMIVAGGVSRFIEAEGNWLEVLGTLDDVAVFYQKIDVVVVPLSFSTGLKIKIAEALTWAVPVVALADAFDGFKAFDEFHVLPDIDAVCNALMELAADRSRLVTLGAASSQSEKALVLAEADGLGVIRGLFAGRRRRLVVLTDALGVVSLAAVRLQQAIEYFADLLPVCVVSLTPVAGHLIRGDVIVVMEACSAIAAIKDLDRADGIVAIFLSTRSECVAAEHVAMQKQWPLIQDRWALIPSRELGFFPSLRDVVLDNGTALTVTPLRYLPSSLNWPADPGTLPYLLVVAGENPDWWILEKLRLDTGHRVVAVCTCSLAWDEAALSILSTTQRPIAIIVLDAGEVTNELARTLADWCGVGCFVIGHHPYPLALEGRLVQNRDDHTNFVIACLRQSGRSKGNERAVDAGWSSIWSRIIELRDHASSFRTCLPVAKMRHCGTTQSRSQS